MRLFIGIPLADAVVRELEAVCRRLRTHADGLRWTAPESWHITLQFLGSATPEQFAKVKVKLAEVHSPPVPLRLGGLGIFDRAGVFIATVDLSAELSDLQQRVVAAMQQCGFAPEERPYQPHITLARAKGDDGRRRLRELKARVAEKPRFTPFTAHEFLLYESHLGPGGSKYEVQGRYELASQHLPTR